MFRRPSAGHYAALGGMGLGKEYGTHFLIKPTAPKLALDLDFNQLSANGAMPLQRFLLGFGNTLHGTDQTPPIVAEFVEHRRDGSSEDLIGPYAFFSPEELASADHHISGSFDEFGSFTSAAMAAAGTAPTPITCRALTGAMPT